MPIFIYFEKLLTLEVYKVIIFFRTHHSMFLVKRDQTFIDLCRESNDELTKNFIPTPLFNLLICHVISYYIWFFSKTRKLYFSVCVHNFGRRLKRIIFIFVSIFYVYTNFHLFILNSKILFSKRNLINFYSGNMRWLDGRSCDVGSGHGVGLEIFKKIA